MQMTFLKFTQLSLVILLAASLVQCRPISGQNVYLNDAGKDNLVLGNNFYEIGLSKENGGIVYIRDKAAQKQVSTGNLNGCLWAATFSVTATTLDACAYSPSGASKFSYAWSPASRQLTLSYKPDRATVKQVAVSVTLTASDTYWLDLQLALENHRGYDLGEVAFPANLVLPTDHKTEALLPIIPGVVLEPAFFSQARNYETFYMGFPGVFADFMSFSSASGSLAIYSTIEENRFTPVKLGFRFNDCVPSGSACYSHNFQAKAKNGSQWSSPKVRLRISEARLDTIKAFREDDGLAAGASIQAKLGELYSKVAQSPLYKADTSQLNLAFKDYPGLLAKIPYPGILHVMGYGPNGFDHSYPDFLPPKTQWGTTQDMAAMFSAAQALGFVTMPYINPTWWDGESPTLKKLPSPLTLTDVVALNESGNQMEECYGCPDNPHRGYVVSPYAPFVQQRLSQLLQQMKTEIPGDIIFEDQIGARATIYDYNPASPSPEAYTQAWIEHTRQYASSLLMTEMGFDALVKTETGFHGSILLQESSGLTDGYWGKGAWSVYPFVTLIARDKALFYQHDLAPETFTHRKATLAWNVAMGYNLSYDLFASSFGGGVNDAFIQVVAAFQRFVLSQYASERITNYSSLQTNVTQTSFENYTAITNWDSQTIFNSGGYGISPSGVLIKKNDGSLIAGVFTSYNGAPLSSGDHYLIEERTPAAIILRQPMGADTLLSTRLLPGWNASTKLEAAAYTIDGRQIGKVPIAISGNNLSFTYSQSLSGSPVAYCQIIITK